ncbi:phosphatidylglycerophosphatase A family protein [Candidatus Midichloria mitochondrii]|uniref:Phosphatidylglycerophosphatase A n=1 Tax=Midichloria mitochondrii (strain IricVA) TaxID=696127 RepID=F7XVX4_MIDMI|nr:phosphatidylglycerophosphatase A [Candidatus Midichloria mitochondrii]AEI88823.1 phosphatidylglycerophosphatase A [Candidatus Midichloria mitochondrii IricVA]
MFFNRGYKRVLKLLREAQKERLNYGFKPTTIIVTWFFLGLFPIAPGTIASLSVYPIYNFLIISSTSYEEIALGFFVLSLIFLSLGWFSISRFQAQTLTHDHQSIVIDEVVGQLLTFAISCKSLLKLGVALSPYFSCHATTLAFFIGVIFFRFFDIKKPFFLKTIDGRMKGAFAVMLDDVLAAIFAGVTITIVYQIYDNFLRYYI